MLLMSMLNLLNFRIGTQTIWILYLVYSCCAQPVLPLVGITFGLMGVRQGDRSRTLALWGIVLCTLAEILFVAEVVYVFYFTPFPRGLIG